MHQPNSTECLFMFGAWLATFEEPITFSSKHDSGQMVRLLECFITENNLPDVTANYPEGLKQPPEVVGAATLFRNWLQSDNETAWNWHCQIACSYRDTGISYNKSNHLAHATMKQLFGCDEYFADYFKPEPESNELIPSTHYWLTSDHGERTLAYYYKNPDTDCLGFGFNIANGGGFVPESDARYKHIEKI